MKHLTRLTLLSIWMLVAPAVTIMSTPTVVIAQENSAKYEAKLASAIEDYDALMIDEAKATLEKAASEAEQEGASGLAVAKIYVMLGIVQFAETHDQSDAKSAFINALAHDYGVELPAVYASPKLSEALEEARKVVEPPKKEAETPVAAAEGGNSSGAVGFRHDTVRTARAGQAVEIKISVASDLPVYHVHLYHRRFGQTDFERLDMKAQGATHFVAQIPAAKVNTSQVEYYIEALNRGDETIGNAGSKSSPLSMTVLGSSSDGAVIAPGGGEGAGDELPIETPNTPHDQNVYVMLTGGTGLGFLFGGDPTAHPNREVSPGIAPAFGHAMLDAGYMVTRNAYVGLYFRWQFSPSQDFDSVPEVSKEPGSFFDTREECFGLGLPGDCMIGAKYRYFFADFSALRMYSSMGAGVGRVRQWLRLKEPYYQADGITPSAQCSGKDRLQGDVADYCYVRDTVRPGWAHIGFGTGLMMPLHENIDLVADTYLVLLLPETGINLDLSVGMNLRF